MKAGPVWKEWFRPTAMRKRGARAASGRSSAKEVQSSRVGSVETTAATATTSAASPTPAA
jgi:hypothetical protein